MKTGFSDAQILEVVVTQELYLIAPSPGQLGHAVPADNTAAGCLV